MQATGIEALVEVLQVSQFYDSPLYWSDVCHLTGGFGGSDRGGGFGGSFGGGDRGGGGNNGFGGPPGGGGYGR